MALAYIFYYDIIEVPKRIFNAAADLEMGKYQNRKCKPVPMNVLYECWKWCQKKLNDINQYNRAHNKGPSNDSDRLAYDLAVVLGKVPQFIAYKEKQNAAVFNSAAFFIVIFNFTLYHPW